MNMRRSPWLRYGLVAAIVALAPLAPAQGSSRPATHDDIRIVFKPGERCWKYSGRASAFRGSFDAGQKLVVTSTGEFHFGDDKGDWVTTAARDVTVMPLQNETEVIADLAGVRHIPQTGDYSIAVGPHAVQGYPGVVIVCRL
jgi:hypothetical protein